MAPINPPTFLQAGTYSARLDRLSQAGMMHADPATGALAVRGGVRPTPSNTGLQVTQRASPGMFVSVAAGTGYVPAQSAVGGCYVVHNDASFDVAIATAHATLARRDLIVARVNDAEYSGVNNTFTLEAVTGTPAGSPVLPATPAGAIPLAQVQVNAAATQILNASITDLRPYTTALGGTIPAPTTARPPNPYKGMSIYDTTLNRPYWYDGSSWRSYSDEAYLTTSDLASYLSANGYVNQAYLTSNNYLTQATLDARAWTTYSVSWGAATTNPSLGNGSIAGRYFTIGKLVIVKVGLNLGTTSTLGSGAWSFNMPFTPASWLTGGFAFGTGAAMLNDSSAGNQVPGTAYIINVAGVYRARIATASGDVAPTIPFAWNAADGDDIDLTIAYQIA